MNLARRVQAGSIKIKSGMGYPLAWFFILLGIVVILVVAMIKVGGEESQQIPISQMTSDPRINSGSAT